MELVNTKIEYHMFKTVHLNHDSGEMHTSKSVFQGGTNDEQKPHHVFAISPILKRVEVEDSGKGPQKH